MRYLFVALQFLTIFPARIQRLNPIDLVRSMAFYPIVGALIAISLYGTFFLLDLFLPHLLSSLVILLVWSLLTGGLHLDGLADTLDGFVGGQDKDSILAIMRDPAIGTMGTIGILLVLALKGAVLFLLSKENVLPSLIFVLATGRYLMIYGAFLSRYPRTDGIGKDYIGKIPLDTFLTAGFFILAITLMALQWKGLILLLLSLFWTHLWVFYCHHRIEGMTGDTLGAVGEVSEAILLILLCLNFYKN